MVKNFLLTFFFLLGVIMSIAVVFDISEKLEDFLTNEPSMKALVIDYYFNFIIFYTNLFSALLIFIAVLFFTAKLAARTEIIAILTSGVSFNRLLVPYFIAATILASLSWYSNNYLVPEANKTRLQFEATYVRGFSSYKMKNIHKQITPDEMIYMESYNTMKNIGYKFAWEKWEQGILKYKMMADFIRWDSVGNQWQIERYTTRLINGLDEDIIHGAKLDTLIPNMLPSDFERSYTQVSTMQTPALKEFIEEQKQVGSDEVTFYEIELYQRTSMPFATYILTLIGVAVASRKTRGGTGIHIALGLGVSIFYILAMKVTTVYATNAGLDPLIAVWIPNGFFAIAAFYIYRKAPK
ncbi:MAG: LptF/LptG family permease [Flavobacteriales bacterium]|nr:LptF/LptG family permease [Flavobacteriales bacterium]